MATRASTRARKPPAVTVGGLSLTPAQAKQAGVLPAQVLERNQRTAALLEAIGHGERGLARHLARNVHEHAGRADKLLRLAGALLAVRRHGVATDDLARWPASAWAILAKVAEVNPPSADTRAALIAWAGEWLQPQARPAVRGREVAHGLH